MLGQILDLLTVMQWQWLGANGAKDLPAQPPKSVLPGANGRSLAERSDLPVISPHDAARLWAHNK